MMRFNIIVTGIFFATGAVAHQASIPKPQNARDHLPSAHVLLDLAHLHLFQLFHHAEAREAAPAESATDHSEAWSRPTAMPDLSVGALHPEFGQDDSPDSGLSAFETQDQLGSSIWKDMQNKSHSAKLMFIWPTGK